MIASEDVTAFATYTAFTGRTRFLVDPDMARGILLGRAAALARSWGDGEFVLFGPHLEHPGYPEANAILVDLVCRASGKRGAARGPLPRMEEEGMGLVPAPDMLSLRRALSNARIQAMALERSGASWTIGFKIYDAGKVCHFLDVLWTRLRSFEAMVHGAGDIEGFGCLLAEARIVERLVDSTRRAVDSQSESSCLAEELIEQLKAMAARFLGIYFRGLVRRAPGHGG